MSGLMRSCPGTVRRAVTVAALGFIMHFPAYEPAAHALSQASRDEKALVDTPHPKEGKEPPENKKQETHDGDPSPIVASMRITTGAGVMKALRANDYAWLIQRDKKLDPFTPRITSAKDAAEWLAAELKVFVEAEVFPREDQLAIMLASVSMHSGTILRTRSLEEREKPAHPYTAAYTGSIRSHGFPKLADTVERWLKNGKGDMLTLYKGMRECVPAR